MRRSTIVGLVVAVIGLLVVSTYLSYMNYQQSMADHGAWSVNFQTVVGTEAGTLQIRDSSIQLTYERHPETKSYSDWLFGQHSNSPEQSDDTTIYTIHIKVDSVVRERIRHTLFDETYAVGLDELSGGIPLTLNKTFGPFVAYNSSLPLKVQYVVEVVDLVGVTQTATGVYYVTQWK